MKTLDTTTLDADFYKDIVVGTSAGFLVIEGEHGSVAAINPAAVSILGYKDGQEIVGKNAVDLLPENLRANAEDILEDLWNEEGPEAEFFHLLTARGDEIPLRLSTHVVVRDDLAYLVMHVSDARQQIEAAARAHQDIRCHNRFITNLAGELRLPFHSLAALADVLTGFALDPKTKAITDLIAASANGMRVLVDDLRELAQTPAENAGQSETVFHLETVLQGIADTFSPTIRERELSYTLNLDRNLPVWLVGDAGRFRQVLVNLIGNALKFTDDGGLTVEVTRQSCCAEQLVLRCNVVDSGCGIPPESLAQIFDECAGTGLYVTRQLVRSMGGELEVESRDDWGSHFSFTVAFKAGPASGKTNGAGSDTAAQEAWAAASLQSSALKPQVTGLRVLLAEDSKVNQVVALGMLRKLGFECETADNGLKAIMLLQSESFDVVFMDLQMPEMGGLEATKEIRAGAAGKHNCDIPIVALTGQASYGDRKICLDAGMQGYVAKPFNAVRLKEAIDRLSGAPEESGISFRLVDLVNQMNGDAELAGDVLNAFHTDMSERLLVASAALAKQEFGVLAEQALAIEEAAAHITARLMASLAQELRRTAIHQEREFGESLLAELVAQLAGIR